MKYIVRIELGPEAGEAMEANPAAIQNVVGKWQALNPIGMYFGMTRRSVTVVVDVPNEDAMFEALHTTWVTTHSYPDVLPVAGADEFPALLQRAGIGG